MKNNPIFKKSEDNHLTLRRCMSTYKKEFLHIDKKNLKNNLISFSEREILSGPILKTFANREISNSNDYFGKNMKETSHEKKLFDLIQTNRDEHYSRNNAENFIENKSKKIKKRKSHGSFLLQSSIKRAFSPQIIKTKIEFNFNNWKKSPTVRKNSLYNLKSNNSNIINEYNSNLLSNPSKKIFLNDINPNKLNNIGLKKIKSASPIRKSSDEFNTSLNKKLSNISTNQSNIVTNIKQFKSCSPLKINSFDCKLENSNKKSEISNIKSEINTNLNEVQLNHPMSPQIGNINKSVNNILGKNFSSNNLLNSHCKNKFMTKTKISNKNLINFSSNYNLHMQNEKNKLLFGSRGANSSNYIRKSFHKKSHPSEITSQIFQKSTNINYNSNKENSSNNNYKLKNKYKINYTAKSYTDLKNNEIHIDKSIFKSKVPNFKLNIKYIKNKFSEISNYNNKNNNYVTHKDNYQISRNSKPISEINHNSLISNFKSEENKNNDNEEEINFRSSNSKISEISTKNSPVLSPKTKIKTKIHNNINNNNLIDCSNIINLNSHLNKIPTGKKAIHTKTISNNLNAWTNLNHKSYSNNQVSSFTKNLMNEKSTRELVINWNCLEPENNKKIKNQSETNLVEINLLTNQDLNKIEQSKGNSLDSSDIIQCYNDNDILDSKDYETRVTSNGLTVNQILTKTTKDDSLQHTIKNINYDNSAKKSKIEGPEDLHFFYVKIFQKKKSYVPKFDY